MTDKNGRENHLSSTDFETADNVPRWEDLGIDEDISTRENEQKECSAEKKTENDGKKVKKKKKKSVGRTIITVLLIAAVVAALIGIQPVSETANRRFGVSTVLIAGTDKAGYRTDTIMLLSLDSLHFKTKLLSIPRDTYVDGYKSPKINSACGIGGGGAEGMEELMTRAAKVIGFRPDAYVLVNLDAFIEVVDLMGGVDFEVPMTMNYDDPAQDLHIHLKEGMQHLGGYDAMGVVRFRKGYKQADLKRVTVQRDFVKAAAKQWLTVKNVTKIPELYRIMKEDVITDLSFPELWWVARSIVMSDLGAMQSDTVPGKPKTIKKVSYYVPDLTAMAELAPEYSQYK